MAGVLGVLGFLGIQAKTVGKIVTKLFQIELRGLKNRARGLQGGVLGFLGILAQNLEKIIPEPSQIEARGFKNRVQRLQNRARSPPRRNFSKMFNLRGSRGACSRVLPGLKSQLGSKLEAQDPPKSRPKPEKIDVKKQHVFGIDFGRVRTLFWKGFR